jgi:hypothetical protein
MQRKKNVSLCVMVSARKHQERVLAMLPVMGWNGLLNFEGFIRMTVSSVFTPSTPPQAPQVQASTSRQHQSHSMAVLYQPALRTVAACSFAAAALLAAAGTVHAQTAAPASPPAAANTPAPAGSTAPKLPSISEVNAAFDRADENHDARLTRAEADRFPEVARRFEQIDTNRDTFISREEFSKAVLGTS